MFSFGSNCNGQLGVDDKLVQISSAPLLVSQLKHSGVHAVQISCGGYHTGVLGDNGQVFMWGRNEKGQCGVTLSSKSQALFAP